jgi:hypothetical protein
VAIIDHNRSENCCVDNLIRTAETTQSTTGCETKATINRKNHMEHTVSYAGADGCALQPFFIVIEAKVVVSITDMIEAKVVVSCREFEKQNHRCLNKKRKKSNNQPLVTHCSHPMHMQSI